MKSTRHIFKLFQCFFVFVFYFVLVLWRTLIPPSVPLQFQECIRPWQFSSLFEWLFILLFVLEPQNVQNLLLLMPKLFLLVPWQFITLALQRALSLCFDTTLSFQAIAMISLGILHINLALQKYCRSSFIPHTPSRPAWKMRSLSPGSNYSLDEDISAPKGTSRSLKRCCS